METTLKRNLDIIQLNIVCLVSLTKYFLTDMVARRSGRILQVGSEAGKTPMPLLSVYAPTKAFVISLSEALSNELKETNAESSRKLMEPSKKRPSQGRSEPEHEASRLAREKINKITGKLNGDYPLVGEKPISWSEAK